MSTASAPGKLMLFGEHAVVYGYPAIVTAVDQRIFATVEVIDPQSFSVVAPQLEVKDYKKPLDQVGVGKIPSPVAFLETLYKRVREKYPKITGVRVTTRSEFSPQFGFGSSSAVTVSFAKALSEQFALNLSNQELFSLCYQTVLDVQGVGSGFDLAAAIWGGTLYYVKPAKKVEPLAVDSLPIVVGYTGVKADTATVVKMVEQQKQQDPTKILKIFDDIGSIVELAKTAMLEKNWHVVGRLMSKNQALLVQLGVSSPILDSLIAAAVTSGSDGAKLSGAGVGDCMLAIADAQHRLPVESSIYAANGQVISVEMNATGVRIEKNGVK